MTDEASFQRTASCLDKNATESASALPSRLGRRTLRPLARLTLARRDREGRPLQGARSLLPARQR
jgi:hypothetical protein